MKYSQFGSIFIFDFSQGIIYSKQVFFLLFINMFDIISYIREKILRRPKLVTPIAGEELSEKQTTKLGYFLLYCMFGAILASAQWTLSIIQKIPERPTSIPNCVTNMIHAFDKESNYYNSYYGYSYNDCLLTAQNPEFDFTIAYNNLQIPFNQINDYTKRIQNLESQKQQSQYNQRNSQQDYNTSLAEKTAWENSWLYNSEEIKNGIKNNRSEITTADNQISELKNSIIAVKSQYSWEIEILREKVKTAENDYRNAYLLYKLYIAILSFLFALVIFTILYKIYVRQKIKNSPYTIIFSVATFAYGLVLLQICIFFIWDIIPHKLMEIILNLLEVFTPLVYLIQFLWPIVIIGIFWFLVYKIQKRLYSPQNILKRFITDKKCPGCGNAVDFTKPFCPLCSHEIQIHCPNCHELSLKGMPYCSNCGGKLPEKDVISHIWNHTFDESLEKEIEMIDITWYTWVRFTPKGGIAFVSNRENIVKLSIYMTKKLWKTEFEAHEFSPYLNQIIKLVKNNEINKEELQRVTWKIKDWAECWWEITLLIK